jgi:hypothetical protein
MKWKLLVLFLVFMLSFSSCCIFKKTRTITKTETLTVIDTVIQIKRDTITLVKEVHLTDTAFIENSISQARSYWSPIKQKIVLELTGKSFEVPVKMIKKETIKTDTREKIPKFNFKVFTWICLIIIIGYLILLAIKIFKR